jgi:molecular chaperone DnaK
LANSTLGEEMLVIGIDYGTSTNFVTRYDFKSGDAVPVQNMGGYGGNNIFENCIYIEGDGKYIVGDTAKKRQGSDPENFFADVKRYITDDTKRYFVPNLGRDVTPTEIATFVFEAVRNKVEANQNEKVDGAVVTVPYTYGKKYRERIKEAIENAGIPLIKLVEEPVAAAISFGLFSDEVVSGEKEKIAVFDLGGGTFDITIFEFQKSDKQHAKVEVLNTDGVEKLGGKTVDEMISEKFREYLKVEYSSFSKDRERAKFQNDLGDVAKTTKEALSESESEDVYENISVNGENRELEIDIEVDDFNSWLKDNNFIGQIEDALDRAIYDIDLEPEDIDRIVLAGGSSSIPIVKETVENFFGKRAESKKELGELVGHGAGILAGLSKDDSLKYTVIRKTSKNVGIALGNKFKTILSKNFRYDEFSPKTAVKLSRKGDGVRISFYEGDSNRIEYCEKIGYIETDEISDGKIYISLVREDKSDSQIRCSIYDSKENLIFNDYLKDI